jgi:hypothetical protein
MSIYKNDHVKNRAELLHYRLTQIMIEMLYYCESYGQPFIVTEAVTTAKEDQDNGRISPSHRECRAIDIRTFHWAESFTKQFVDYFTEKYNDIGAVSLSNKKRRFIVDKSKTRKPHLHIQLDKIYAKQPAWKH